MTDSSIRCFRGEYLWSAGGSFFSIVTPGRDPGVQGRCSACIISERGLWIAPSPIWVKPGNDKNRDDRCPLHQCDGGQRAAVILLAGQAGAAVAEKIHRVGAS